MLAAQERILNARSIVGTSNREAGRQVETCKVESRGDPRVHVEPVDKLTRLKVGLRAIHEARAALERKPHWNRATDNLPFSAQELHFLQFPDHYVIVRRHTLKLLAAFGNNIESESRPVFCQEPHRVRFGEDRLMERFGAV